MTRTLRWFLFLVSIDLIVSSALLIYAPTKAHEAVTCLSEAVTK